MIADVLVALADPTRRKVFELVAERPCPVGELAAQMPVSRPAVSQHLRVLRLAGLVQEHRQGTRRVYSLDSSGLETVRTYFDTFWEGSLAAFKAAVEQSDPSEKHVTKEAP